MSTVSTQVHTRCVNPERYAGRMASGAGAFDLRALGLQPSGSYASERGVVLDKDAPQCGMAVNREAPCGMPAAMGFWLNTGRRFFACRAHVREARAMDGIVKFETIATKGTVVG